MQLISAWVQWYEMQITHTCEISNSAKIKPALIKMLKHLVPLANERQGVLSLLSITLIFYFTSVSSYKLWNSSLKFVHKILTVFFFFNDFVDHGIQPLGTLSLYPKTDNLH